MREKDFNYIVLQNILHNIDIGIHVIDKNRKTVLYNKAMAKLEGLSIDQVLNKDLLELFPSLNEETSTLIKVLTTREPILEKTQIYINFKGQNITSLNSTIPLFYKGEIIGAMEIAKDITYIKKLSDKLMDLQRELKGGKEKYNSNGSIKRYTFEDIIGKNKKIVEAIEIAKRTSTSPSSVLIYGETGTGKELFAQSIHYDGNRRNKPFIAQNCAAIPETLLEGILFGTEKGGFTGAVEREGIFEQAHGGTLLLDEINSMSLNLQTKLLRVLQEGYIRRIGGTKDIPIDVKIIATTNEDPLESVKKGTIRKDLYYRLNVVYIHIPPLRERTDDIISLTNHFINKYNMVLNRNITDIDGEVLNLFFNYSWPGNVRELENTIEAAMNYASMNRTVLRKEDFKSTNIFDNSRINDFQKPLDVALPEYLEGIEKEIIRKSLDANDYNISQTAKALGIKRQTLQYKIKKYYE
ncbi:sigma-54 interaction domain-containing protein [Tepidimicrobium xylanilyticum]|uniref:Arginine utilization regulatory protein n=2 Tax=Tepidimicrobium xylanilyticum TaxID=1123352 RepID=A0A1H2SNM5_9FIRM|nr:sigma 54-interacting transcriptional regulator [Tepidimicrobium xylanilyticum]GMG96162.1 sigma-54-dependent Fis family transcriptional regulator [Tepidimicrobium xylanilyticum]SDW33236.1 arginine utilization regulatory protein [Tepidimicrobium xylanilyticum]